MMFQPERTKRGIVGQEVQHRARKSGALKRGPRGGGYLLEALLNFGALAWLKNEGCVENLRLSHLNNPPRR